MSVYKGIDFDDSLSALVRHMDPVQEYRETLQGLQAVWDNLTLLGQLSGTGTDMSATRQAFAALTADLLNHLGIEMRSKTVQALKSKAQVAVDILVRNLFERTADIGFLAQDDDIRAFVRRRREVSATGDGQSRRAQERQALELRFREYVRKYSVYHDIILLTPEGEVLAQLDERKRLQRSSDPLLREALDTEAAYVEVFRAADLLGGERPGLIYAYRVAEEDGEALAVLCLCFRFESETRRIFANLTSPRDWTVLTLLDAQDTVIASSDPHHLPVGAQLERVSGADWGVVRFGGREYLAATRATQGYQGYMGPGWLGHAMIPLDQAFVQQATSRLAALPARVSAAVTHSPTLFSEALRNIPRQAERIQRALNRSVWNGNVRQNGSEVPANSTFSKILLWEISNTGLKTTDVFERSIGNLNETVISSLLDDACFLASLAIDIMDRNLYERANDCRWWALTSAFAHHLENPGDGPEAARAAITRILQAINALYTVYDNLVVFDAGGRALAVSNQAYAACVGQPVGEEWVRRALALTDTQSYVVSAFAPSALYRGRHTYVYAAAIGGARGGNGRMESARGGIGIVFDAEPQFRAMLLDALPRDAHGEILRGSFGVFADRTRQVIATTDARHPIGSTLELPTDLFQLPNGGSAATVAELDGSYHAVGVRMSSGYREYKSADDAYRNDVAALIFVPLAEVADAHEPAKARPATPVRLPRLHHGAQPGGTTEIATFFIGEEWLGVVSSHVQEAVDAVDITPVPGLPAHVRGLFIYQERPIIVLDLGGQLRLRRDADPETYQQIVIVRAGKAEPFGILVHRLGEIPEVANERIDPVNRLYQNESALAEHVVRPDGGRDERGILVVLSPARILAQLLGGGEMMLESTLALRDLAATPAR
ncbi:chemotaxis protein CheW [Pseudothauera nasutitermitis]|uniref:Chemotaxis protein CheW n=1 Tax=Pseudothauera nasutitermitis TaxID=2565930 RepID=A0A4S4B280_9RHOO|nr:chemotaxis protein CheW [Pseudothauera nasutitermitis]THF66603.1 chemotaxis protein CheW [Pseudothauera nasutitermitis]